MRLTDQALERLKDLFYPLMVEILDISPYNHAGSVKVTACTGKYSVSMMVTPRVLESGDIQEMVEHLKKQLNYDLEKKIIEDYLSGVGERGFIVTTSMPVDKVYTIVHPEMYKEILKHIGFEHTHSDVYVDWKKRLGE